MESTHEFCYDFPSKISLMKQENLTESKSQTSWVGVFVSLVLVQMSVLPVQAENCFLLFLGQKTMGCLLAYCSSYTCTLQINVPSIIIDIFQTKALRYRNSSPMQVVIDNYSVVDH